MALTSRGGGDGHGIEAAFLDGDPNNRGPHHIAILNNLSHNNAGSGIGVAFGDFYMIVGNTCCHNCGTNKYQGSGISLYEARPVADLTAGFHNVVRNNICFGNSVIDLPGNPEPSHSDGNGIIIDDFRNLNRRIRLAIMASTRSLRIILRMETAARAFTSSSATMSRFGITRRIGIIATSSILPHGGGS